MLDEMDFVSITIALVAFAAFYWRRSTGSTRYERSRGRCCWSLGTGLAYLCYALLRGDELWMRARAGSRCRLPGRADRAHPAARRLHGPRYTGQPLLSSACSARSSASSTGCSVRRPEPSRTGRPTPRPRCSARSSSSSSTWSCGRRGSSRSTPRVRLGHLGRLLQHHRIVRHNTNWQYYGGETPSPTSPDGRPHRPELHLGGGGHGRARRGDTGSASRGSAELGNFWRDVTRTLLYILLPMRSSAPGPGLAGSDPDPERLDQFPT